MHSSRFDSLARVLARRTSRRGAVRTGGVGLAALVGAGSFRSVAARQQSTEKYAVVRRYKLTDSTTAVDEALSTGYLPQLDQQSGFVEYMVVTSGEDVITITVFADEASLQAAVQAEADWIAQNLASLLPAPEDSVQGNVVVFGANAEAVGGTCPTPVPGAPTATAGAAATSTAVSGPTATTAPDAPTATVAPADPTATPEICTDPDRPGVGCSCTTGTQNPCGDNTLLCCATGDQPGGPGVCTPSSVGCDPMGPTPTPEICTDPSRPGLGCSCITGTQNPCGDNTLLCCATGDQPGGPGVCTSSSVGCDPMGPTPTPTATPPCTGEGCDCATGTENPCGGDLVCCPNDSGTPGGPGTCREEEDCGCTAEGCHCATGTESPCDDGLICCPDQSGLLGSGGTCQPSDECAGMSTDDGTIASPEASPGT